MSKSIIDMERELASKKELLKKLKTKKAAILKRLKSTDRQISSVMGRGRKRIARRGRPAKQRTKRRSSLVLSDVMVKVMKGKGSLKVADVAKSVVKAGYKTRSKTFGNIVSHTLKKDERFTKVRRGLYKLK